MIRLANRRFVSFYFDLSNRGAAGDPAARKFVVKAKPRLGGRAVPTPPVLLMTPDGKVLGEASNYASPEKVLAVMLKVLADNPAYNTPTADEQNEKNALKRAAIAMDLHQFDKARKTLANEKSDEAYYLLGRLARFRGDWKDMETQFSKIKGKKRSLDLRMERVYHLWHTQDFQRLAAKLKGFPKSHPRFEEARYYEGLALFHEGEKEAALKIWSQTIKAAKQESRWIYRADWAYTAVKQGNKRFFSSGGKPISLLGRIGYMSFRGNPDLKPQKKK